MSAGSPRSYDLAAARPEGWFDEVLKQSPDFERASQIIGRSTLGLALVAGARIASLTPSAVSQSKTSIEFSIGAALLIVALFQTDAQSSSFTFGPKSLTGG